MIDRKIDQQKEETGKLQKTIEELQERDVKKTRHIEKLQYENSLKYAKIQEIMVKLDSFEQAQYEKDVQLVGLPESTNHENDMSKVLKLANKTMGQKIKEADVEEVIRLGRKSDAKPRDTIIRFKNKRIRDDFYSNRKKISFK